jgi:hypothetical protein
MIPENYNLPPGCTDADIEGPQCGPDEADETEDIELSM